MSRSALFTGAGALLVFLWVLWPRLGMPPFSAHMVMHMGLVVLVAPLLALALAGGPWDPVSRAPTLCSPIAASMIELVVVWAWHAPDLHDAARHHSWVRALEQLSFLAAGLFLWISALGGGAQRRRQRAAGGVTALLLTSMHMTLLGALLALGHRPLFDHGAPTAGLSPVHDQQLGGAIMLLSGGFAYLAGALLLVTDIFRQKRRKTA